jgi:hypothetical protein
LVDQEAKVEVRLAVEVDGDEQDVDEATSRLRRELLELDVDAVDRPPGPDPPPGARVVEAFVLGELLLRMTSSTVIFAEVAHVVLHFVRPTHAAKRSLRLRSGDDILEISDPKPEDKELIVAWLERHSAPAPV